MFDPLGLIAPITIRGKMLIQKLWLARLDWDESVPLDIHAFLDFRNELQSVNLLTISRQVGNESCLFELHGFSDTSANAYVACVYYKEIDVEGNIKVHLLCAKSKVAPLKTQTIPRLELCGAVLLVQLMKKVVDALKFTAKRVFYWTDSSIVLSWLQGADKKWKVFVANRIAEICETTNIK